MCPEPMSYMSLAASCMFSYEARTALKFDDVHLGQFVLHYVFTLHKIYEIFTTTGNFIIYKI